jgi:hypothetical protein
MQDNATPADLEFNENLTLVLKRIDIFFLAQDRYLDERNSFRETRTEETLLDRLRMNLKNNENDA